jgi:uncharacterized membrane protein
VAIAVTLLVLPLVDVVGEVHRGVDVGDFLDDNRSQIGAFVLSFVVNARLWLAHHLLFVRVRSLDGGLKWLSLFWCLMVVWLPVPSALVAADGGDRVVQGLYVGSMLLSSALLTGLALWLGRHPRLVEGSEPVRPDTFVATTALQLIAFVVAVTADPPAGYWSLLVLLLSGVLIKGWRRARHGVTRGSA